MIKTKQKVEKLVNKVIENLSGSKVLSIQGIPEIKIMDENFILKYYKDHRRLPAYSGQLLDNIIYLNPLFFKRHGVFYSSVEATILHELVHYLQEKENKFKDYSLLKKTFYSEFEAFLINALSVDLEERKFRMSNSIKYLKKDLSNFEVFYNLAELSAFYIAYNYFENIKSRDLSVFFDNFYLKYLKIANNLLNKNVTKILNLVNKKSLLFVIN